MDIISRVKALYDIFNASADRVLDIDRTVFGSKRILRVLFAERPSFIDINEGCIMSEDTEGREWVFACKIVDGVMVMWPEK